MKFVLVMLISAPDETKFSSGASRITVADKLIKMVQYSTSSLIYFNKQESQAQYYPS